MTDRPYAPHPDRARFGAPDGDPARFAERPAAYGLLQDEAGRLAAVRIRQSGSEWFDLPGGAVEPGETEAEALVREFTEETGLSVQAGDVFARADHFWVKARGRTLMNRAAYFSLTRSGPAGAPSEPDHTLVWLSPVEAMTRMRHEAAAWAIARWLRLGGP